MLLRPGPLPEPLSVLEETLGRGPGWVALRGKGPRSVPGGGVHPVWHSGGGLGPLPVRNPAWAVCAPGHPGSGRPLPAHLHPAARRQEAPLLPCRPSFLVSPERETEKTRPPSKHLAVPRERKAGFPGGSVRQPEEHLSSLAATSGEGPQGPPWLGPAAPLQVPGPTTRGSRLDFRTSPDSLLSSLCSHSAPVEPHVSGRHRPRAERHPLSGRPPPKQGLWASAGGVRSRPADGP